MRDRDVLFKIISKIHSPFRIGIFRGFLCLIGGQFERLSALFTVVFLLAITLLLVNLFVIHVVIVAWFLNYRAGVNFLTTNDLSQLLNR